MKKINFKKVLSGRNVIFSLFILAVVFLFGHSALATFGTWAGEVVGSIIAVFIKGVAAILILLVGVLMNVAAYSNFIHAEAVNKGWVVVRDVCNMFFVVILLVIAFTTILGLEEYGAKKMLPKLVMAAVLINFSKMLCGLMIDVASVVMLTFVNAFSAIGAGNILSILGIDNINKIDTSATAPVVTFSMIVASYIFSLLYVIIALVVVASMLGMLVMRIVMIWILVVLSPLAFFLQAVPGKGQQYATQWWTKWTSNLIVGPVIAFFLWLSFAALQTDGNPLKGNASGDAEYQKLTQADSSGIGTQGGTTDSMAKFVIAIGMLLGGMKIAQEVGGDTGAALGKGMNTLNKGRTLALGAVTGAATGAAVALGKGAGRRVRNTGLSMVGGLANAAMDVDPATGKKKNSVIGGFAYQWRDDMKASRKKEKAAGREKFLKKIGVGEKSAEKGQVMLDNAKIQGVGQVGASMAKHMAAGSLLGPVGTAIGAFTGFASGVVSKKRFDKAKAEKTAYENPTTGRKVADDQQRAQLSRDVAANPNHVATQAQKDAVENYQKNEKNKKIISGDDFAQTLSGGGTAYEVTTGAMKNMTKKKKAAQDWVKSVANNPNADYLENTGGKGSIYSSAGLSEVSKKRYDELNAGGADANRATANLVTEVSRVGRGSLSPEKLEELSKSLAAYQKGGDTIDPTTLGQLSAALTARSQTLNPDNFTGSVLTQYKKLGSNVDRVDKGNGALKLNTFATNSAKSPVDRNSRKDIVGASFGKINEEAKKMGMGDILDEAEGATQKIDGSKMTQVNQVLSKIIDNEIASLETVANNVNSTAAEKASATTKIKEANVSKERINSGKLSGLAMENTDVVYKGTDSEKRKSKYNLNQHEIMHNSGAKNEEIVYDSADALQSAGLIGRIPKSNGQSYDQEIGKMIADMEKQNLDPNAIRQAVASQIDGWQVPNAQRVIETENGERDTVKDLAPEASEKSYDSEKVVDAIEKLTEVVGKQKGSQGGGSSNKIDFDIPAQNFLRSRLKDVQDATEKGSEVIAENLKPLEAIAASEESKKAA